MDTKYCKLCGQDKPLTEYYTTHSKTYCMDCTRKRNRDHSRAKTLAKKRHPHDLEPRACGVCGRPIRTFTISLCKQHRGREYDGMRCESCPLIMYCRERVKVGLWVLCECPDQADLVWAKTMDIIEIDYRPEANYEIKVQQQKDNGRRHPVRQQSRSRTVSGA